jgi:hypothetical protein
MAMAFVKMTAVVAMLALPQVFAGTAQAQDLATPTGEVILTVTGKISRTNAGDAAAFDVALLDSLPQHGFETSTIWTEGVDRYDGVLLVDLLAAVGATGATVRATALNDYRIDFPVDEAQADGPLLAYRTNGDFMSVRDKGPVWLIYPYDDADRYRSEETYAQSIWQLDRIEIAD